MRNTYIHEIGQMRMQYGNRRVCASISNMHRIHALFSIELTTRYEPSSLPSFLVMLTMRPTWRRAYTNFRHFSPLHRKWTLRATLINIDCAKEFGISSADVHVYVHVCIRDSIDWSWNFFFALCILRFIMSFCIPAFEFFFYER